MQYLENLLMWAKKQLANKQFYVTTKQLVKKQRTEKLFLTFPFLGTKDFSQGLDRHRKKKLIDILQPTGGKKTSKYSTQGQTNVSQ